MPRLFTITTTLIALTLSISTISAAGSSYSYTEHTDLITAVDTASCTFRRAVRPDGAPLVIAHRGASGYLPEHTLAAYAAAYFMGADVIEPDVVLTKDGVLICSHNLTLDSTTDVAEKFPGRNREDGKHHAIDFTLAEIKTLGRDSHAGGPSQPGHTIPTLEEMIALVHALNEQTGRTVGIIPEPKGPAFHRSEGMPIEAPLLDTLAGTGYTGPDDRCVVQCFDLVSLEHMRNDLGTKLPLAYLIGKEVPLQELRRAAKVCSALGPRRTLLLERDGAAWRPLPTLDHAKELGLALYPWTFGDAPSEMAAFFSHGIDGLFTDYTDMGVQGRARAAP